MANIYLYYVFDLWAHQWRRHQAQGAVIVVRYADDTIVGFQDSSEASRFLVALKGRLQQFGLSLHPAKTRLVEFGRYAAERRKRRGQGKPETFNFLGFTHFCGKSRTSGNFVVRRVTMAKRLRAALQAIKANLLRHLHRHPADIGRWLQRVVRGYFNYHAVPGNYDRLASFRTQVIHL